MQQAKAKRLERESKIPANGPVELDVPTPPQRRRGRPRKQARSEVSLANSTLAEVQQMLGPITSQAGMDLTEKVKDLIRLAKDQGHLSYEDVNDALPDELVTPDDLDQVLTKLRNLEIEIIDPAEVDRNKLARRRRKRPLRYSRRPGADVFEANGQGAFADARAGSRNLQADRGRR